MQGRIRGLSTHSAKQKDARPYSRTNSDGKCRVIINGPGASVTDNTILLVHVKRVDPVSGQTVISASVKVHLRQYNTITYDSPFVSSAISPGTGISYHDSFAD